MTLSSHFDKLGGDETKMIFILAKFRTFEKKLELINFESCKILNFYDKNLEPFIIYIGDGNYIRIFYSCSKRVETQEVNISY